MTGRTWECWAMVYPDGSIVANSYQKTAHAVWEDALQYPFAPKDILSAELMGARVIRVRITELSEVEDDHD